MPRVAWPIPLDPKTKEELRRLARSPSTSQAIALRARIILGAARGLSNQEIAAALGVTENTVTKWRKRFLSFGTEGLSNLGHGGRPVKYGPEVHQRLRRLLRQEPPGGRERWTFDQLSRELNVPRSTVHEMVAADVYNRRRSTRRRRG